MLGIFGASMLGGKSDMTGLLKESRTGATEAAINLHEILFGLLGEEYVVFPLMLFLKQFHTEIWH